MTRFLVACVWLAACGQKADRAPASQAIEPPYTGPFSPRPSPSAEAVAEVNGEIIWDVDIAAYAAEKQLGAREALAELIDLELLAQEARRRGLGQDPEVVEVRRRERVRRLVDAFAEETRDPSVIPDADVDVVWKRREVQAALNHGPIHVAGFVRVRADKRLPPAEIEAARVQAEAIRAAVVAAKPASYEEFQRIAGEHHLKQTGKSLTVEKSYPIEATTRAEQNFKDAALALSKAGQISPVVRTKWGWDVLYLVEVIPPLTTTRAEAAPEIRRRIHDDWRRQAFRRWLDAFLAPVHVARRDEALDRVDVDSTFGLP